MRIETQLAYFGLKPTIAMEVDGVGSVLDAVHEGYGCAVLPRLSLGSHRSPGDFVARAIVRPKLTIQLSLVVSAQRPTTVLAQQVLQLLPSIAVPLLKGPAPV
jgi:LysR family nitrogen assimilation transcriptional regulator